MKEPRALFGLVDPKMQGNFTLDSLCKAVEVALMCLEDDPECRPHMDVVVEAMIYITSPNDAAAAAVVERPTSIPNVAEKDEIVEEKENEETRLLSGATVESHVVEKDEIEEEEEDEDDKARLVSRRRSQKRPHE